MLILHGAGAFSQLGFARLLCENKVNPLGVALQSLRFSWELASTQNNRYQTAWQLVISSSPEKLDAGIFDIYNSGKIGSRQSILNEYKGEALHSAETYFWSARVWDNNGKPSGWSEVQQFTTGIFERKDWANAKWIGYQEMADSMRVVPGVHAPLAGRLGNKCMQRPVVPVFRKEFIVQRKIKKALLFITGLGQYEVQLNGAKTGDAFLSPGWTNYDKRVLYNTYDITRQLTDGANAISVTVGNGFYNINRERYFKLVLAFGFPKMICRIKIIYADGSIENIVSDESWKANPSPITFSSIYGGEDYDARLEQKGWNLPGLNDSGWQHALTAKTPLGKLMPEQDYPVRFFDSFQVKKIKRLAPGKYIYDFGQNISGIVRIKVSGKRGQMIKLTPAELLTGESLPDQKATGAPYYFSYTLKGEGEESWQPKFSYYGFRYVEVEGAVPDTAENSSGLPVILQAISLHNHNSNPSVGTFACSNDLFNRIYMLISRAITSNMQSVLTDCPHREKLSWLEQDYLMGGSIHYNYDIYSLYRKLIFDLQDAQHAKGFVPDIAPEYVVFAGGFLDSPEWGSASVLLPWFLYQWYADKNTLREAYPMMKKYLAYLESRCRDHILDYGLGDWFDYGPEQPGVAQLTPKAVTATAIFYFDATIMAKTATVLHRPQDAAVFQQMAAGIKRSFNKEFFNTKTNVYATGSQTAMAMPLCVGLVDADRRQAVLRNLEDSIYSNNRALTAGDIGFHFLIRALDEGGASQLIYDMNNRDDVPGYGYQLKKGATSLTESWPALENVSNNHLMLGHIMEWFYSGLAGIGQEPNSVAFRHIRIRPQPVGDIHQAKAAFHSPYGWISSAWERENNKFSMQVKIPVNSEATIYVPGITSGNIYINGKKWKDAIRADGHPVLIKTGSGIYHIVVEQEVL
jgi:hypothetical protein